MYSTCTSIGRESSAVDMNLRIDLYTKAVLTAIALLLAALATRPAAVQAQQNEPPNLYIEPGTAPIRSQSGGIPSDGKVIINMSTGEVWGYPTHGAGAPYPIETLPGDSRPSPVKPVYLGKFDFSQFRRR